MQTSVQSPFEAIGVWIRRKKLHRLRALRGHRRTEASGSCFRRDAGVCYKLSTGIEFVARRTDTVRRPGSKFSGISYQAGTPLPPEKML